MPYVPRILVVDDDEGVRKLVTAALNQFGYRVVVTATPTEALKIAESDEPIDLLLTDLMMPEMRGDELARILFQKHKTQKVIYLTGFSDRLYDVRPSLSKHETVVEKPVTLTELHDAVSLTLFGHRGGIMT